MKYIVAALSAILLYFIARPLATIWYILLYRKAPNFKVYFYYTEKSALQNMEKYLVFRNIMDYVITSQPIITVYSNESKKYRYFPKRS